MSLVGRYSSLPLNVSYRLSSDSNAIVGSNPVLFFLLGTILKTKMKKWLHSLYVTRPGTLSFV